MLGTYTKLQFHQQIEVVPCSVVRVQTHTNSMFGIGNISTNKEPVCVNNNYSVLILNAMTVCLLLRH